MLSYVIGNYQYCCVYSTQSRRLTPCSFFLKHNFKMVEQVRHLLIHIITRFSRRKIRLLKWLKIAGGCQKVAPFAWIYPPTNRNLSAFPAELSCLKCPRCNSCTIDPPTVFKIKSFLFCTSTEHISQMYIIVGF